MHEGLRSPNIHTPSNLSEYAAIVQHYPTSTLWAMGSYIMAIPDSYPSRVTNEEIISLAGIEELHRFQRNDRIAEFGAMVTMNEILQTGRTILSKVLVDNIKSLGGMLITDRITVGGALATRGFRSSIAGTLAILDTSCEIKYMKKKRMRSKWMPLSSLFDKNGKIDIDGLFLISRIRILFNNKSYQRFLSSGPFMKDTGEMVSLAFVGNPEQDIVNDARIAITYPNLGFACSRDLDNLISSVRFPLDKAESASLGNAVLEMTENLVPGISPLQRTRTRGMINEIINDLNINALTSPLTNDRKKDYLDWL